MTPEQFKQYAKEHQMIIPQSYLDAMLSCENHPEKICRDYGDVNLFSFEELVEAQESMCMAEYCPHYLAIGDTGGGEVLLMEQKTDANSVIVTGAGNLIPKYWDDTVCQYIDHFQDWVLSGCPNIFEDEDDEDEGAFGGV